MLRKIIILSFTALCAFSAAASVEERCHYYARISQADFSEVELKDIKNTKLRIRDEMGLAQTIKRLDKYSRKKDNTLHYHIDGHAKSNYFSLEPRGQNVYLEFTLYEKDTSLFNFGPSHDVHSRINLVFDIEEVFKKSKQVRTHSQGFSERYISGDDVELQAGIKAKLDFRKECFGVHPYPIRQFF